MGKSLIIGVIGHTGMVGGEVYRYFKKKGFKVWGFSIDEKGGVPNSSWGQINKNCNVIFICVPTPYDWKRQKANLSIVESVVGKIAPEKIVVIKSTVWPGTTERLQKRFSNLYLIFNPEFLSRDTAQKDFEYPDRQLIGYTKKSKPKAKLISKILPKGKYHKIIKAGEAELIKYAHNIYGAMRIIYANHLYEVCKKLGLDYDEVKNGFATSEFIGPGILRYMTIFHNNKRGYGGPCFPKDVNIYLEFCEAIGVDAELIKATRKANQRILLSQGLTEAQVEGK